MKHRLVLAFILGLHGSSGELLARTQPSGNHCIVKLVEETASAKNADSLMNSISKGTQEKKLVNTMDKQVSIISGVPSFVKRVHVDENKVYRHYSMNGIDKIIQESQLRAGAQPFMVSSSWGFKNIYESLSGAFITTPDILPKDVGMEILSDYEYIDFTLRSSTGLLQAEKNIFFIPGKTVSPDWLVERYSRWLKGEYTNPDSSELNAFEKMKDDPLESISIPIHIIQYRKQGKTIRFGSEKKNEVIETLYQNSSLRGLYDSDSGVTERYTVKEHTLRVFNVFSEQFPLFKERYKFKTLKNIRLNETLKYTIALHDIGKPFAIQAGDKHRQHEFTVPILEKTLRENGFTNEEINLAKALVGNDTLGEFAKKNISFSAAKSALTRSAKEAEMNYADFVPLQILFFVIDASSYPNLRNKIFTTDEKGLIIHKELKFDDLLNE